MWCFKNNSECGLTGCTETGGKLCDFKYVSSPYGIRAVHTPLEERIDALEKEIILLKQQLQAQINKNMVFGISSFK